MIHLATGLAVRRGRVLLVASRYPNHLQPLWNLPGGRQRPGELLGETVVREFFEETGLRVRVKELAYVSESYDGDEHFINVTFRVVIAKSPIPSTRYARSGQARAQGDKGRALGPSASLRMTQDHVVEVAWVPLADLARRITVRVVRKPLLAYLRGALSQRFAGFHEAGVTIEWPDDCA